MTIELHCHQMTWLFEMVAICTWLMSLCIFHANCSILVTEVHFCWPFMSSKYVSKIANVLQFEDKNEMTLDDV